MWTGPDKVRGNGIPGQNRDRRYEYRGMRRTRGNCQLRGARTCGRTGEALVDIHAWGLKGADRKTSSGWLNPVANCLNSCFIATASAANHITLGPFADKVDHYETLGFAAASRYRL